MAYKNEQSEIAHVMYRYSDNAWLIFHTYLCHRYMALNKLCTKDTWNWERK